METRKIRLDYPIDRVGVPVFSQLAQKFDVEPNVLAADIAPGKGGWLVLSVSGETARLDEAAAWLASSGITVSTSA